MKKNKRPFLNFRSFASGKFLLCFTCFLPFVSFAQNKKLIDSLELVLKSEPNDTSKVNNLNNLCWEYVDAANYPQALSMATSAQQLSRRLHYKKGEAHSYNNMGVVYYYQSDYPHTLENYLNALKLFEETGDQVGIAIQTGNIGMVYTDQEDYPKASAALNKALEMNKKLGRTYGVAKSYAHIGLVYKMQNDNVNALKNYEVALNMYKKIGKAAIKEYASEIDNIGNIYYDARNLDKALDCYKEAIAIFIQEHSMQDVVLNMGNMGAIYLDQNKYKEAEAILTRSLKMSDSLGLLFYSKDNHQNLSGLYEKLNEPAKALFHYKAYVIARDSIYNEDNTKKLVRSEMNFEFEKKQAIEKAEQDKKDLLAKEEQEKQAVIRNMFIIGFLMVLLLALAILRGYRTKQKANIIITRQKQEVEKRKEEVEKQKTIIEEKNKDITDSINYAQRIQRTLFASGAILSKYLPEHFIFFKPKDIVSGDFYWATEKDGRFYLAICDSTGHGVPGAFMSLLNISFLNEAITERGIASPDEIFNHVRQRLIENVSSQGAKDGMDGVLLCIEKQGEGLKVDYAAAYNAPVLIRNNEVIQLTADKMPVGMGENVKAFQLRTIELAKSDQMYLYTDGYADQFGGEKGKKFKYRQLKELLLQNAGKPMEEQRITLDERIEKWKGEMEQVDDILIMGIRL